MAPFALQPDPARITNIWPVPFDKSQMSQAAAALAARGVYIGTSSWRYPGWCGMLYNAERYHVHGRFSQAQFNRVCLAEYSEVFKTVCVDAAYYRFPDRAQLEQLVAQVPPDFLFALKVTDEITIKTYPNLTRFGLRAGKPNENFLNAELFESAFLSACAPFKDRIGVLIFEFSQFHLRDFARGRDFVTELDKFLGKIPKGWRYAVEVRNRTFLHPDYFAVLAAHGVAHVYNSWTEMPPVHEQLALPQSRTCPEFCVARFLLAPGRRYEDAVKMFSPYDRVREVNADGRAAGAKLIKDTVSQGGRAKAFVYVNNRFEGNALESIAAMVTAVGIG
ncbi:MAG: DUF72 domain-containing protein [Verrucomicrobiae bacterium]|nr:DUF72 domain-containing protein [Verrucomicrobiae bacterium]